LVQEAMAEWGVEAHAISAVTQRGVQDLMKRAFSLLGTLPAPEPALGKMAVFRPDESEESFAIEQERDGWRIRGVRVERVAAMTPFVLPEAVSRFQRQLRAMGVVQALEEAGIQSGDMVRIGEWELEWQPERHL
jgi:GTP-binding protein